MFSNRFVFIDTCILAGALKRNIILWLAEAGFFRPYWSEEVLAELRATREKQLASDQGDERINRLLGQMRRAFPEAIVTPYPPLSQSLGALFPDHGDGHVLAAAIAAHATVLATDNLRDFPKPLLDGIDIEVKSSDTLIADLISLEPQLAARALRTMRLGFQNPEMTPARLLDRMREVDLIESADELAPFSDQL